MSEETTRLRIVVDPSGAPEGANKVRNSLDGVRKAARDTTGSVNELQRAFRLAAAAFAGAFGIRELIRYADGWTLINARLALVTKGAANLTAVQRELFRIAQSTRTEFDATATLYTRMARSAGELGRSQQEMLLVTETITKALRVGGTSAQEAASGVIQLSQALASGQLRGDEFRSVMENMPGVARAIADGMGVSIGKLRELASEGELTANTVVGALLKMRESVDRDFAKLPVTIGEAGTYIRNEIQRWVGRFNEASGASSALAKAMMSAADALRGLTDADIQAAVAGMGALAKAIVAVTGAWVAFKVAAAAGAIFTALMGPLSLVIAAVGTLTALFYTLKRRQDELAASNRDVAATYGDVMKAMKGASSAQLLNVIFDEATKLDQLIAKRNARPVQLDNDPINRQIAAQSILLEDLRTRWSELLKEEQKAIGVTPDVTGSAEERARAAKEYADALNLAVESGYASAENLRDLVERQYALTGVVIDGTKSLKERARAQNDLLAVERALSAEWQRQRNINMAFGNARIGDRYSGQYGDFRRNVDMGVNRRGGVVQAPLGFDPQQFYNEVTGGGGIDWSGLGQKALMSIMPTFSVESVISTLATAATELFGMGDAAFETAKRLRELRRTLAELNAELKGDELGQSLLRLDRQHEELRSLESGIPGLTLDWGGRLGEPERQSDVWRRRREQQIRDEFAFDESQRSGALGVRSMRARGLGPAADALEVLQQQGRELFEAIQRGASAAELATIAAVQAEERLASQRQREAERLRQQLDLTEDIGARRAALGGDPESAAAIRLQTQQRHEIAAAQELYDAGLITIEMLQDLADVLNLELARAAENARQQIEGRRIGFDFDIMARRAALGGDDLRAAEIRRIAAAGSELAAARELYEAGVITEQQLLELSDVLNDELAQAATDAAQAIQDAADAMAAAKRALEQDIQYQWLELFGGPGEAERFRLEREYEEAKRRAEEQGLAPEWLDKLKQILDANVGRLQTGGYTGPQLVRDLPTDPARGDVVRSVTGVTETSALRLVDVAHSHLAVAHNQLAVLRRIEANTRSGRGLSQVSRAVNETLGLETERDERLSGSAA